VNNVRVADVAAVVTLAQAIERRFLLIRMGKKRYHLVALRG
jgi:hypothetical protein